MGEIALKEGNREGSFDIKIENLDLGRPDSMRYNVLTWVLQENYDKAIEALKECMEGDSEYPDFKAKSTRYLNHCVDLVFAIKAKRRFPGMNSLTRSKQQELKEKYKMHMFELQGTLMRIEIIRHNLRVNDVRSTIYVVKALWIASLAIITLGFFIELSHGLVNTTWIVFGDVIDRTLGWAFRLIGF